MNKVLGLCLRAAVSVLIASLLMVLVSSLLHWARPEFSIDFFDMLALRSPSAWLLFALATAIVFVALARLQPFRKSRSAGCQGSAESE